MHQFIIVLLGAAAQVLGVPPRTSVGTCFRPKDGSTLVQKTNALHYRGDFFAYVRSTEPQAEGRIAALGASDALKVRPGVHHGNGV